MKSPGYLVRQRKGLLAVRQFQRALTQFLKVLEQALAEGAFHRLGVPGGGVFVRGAGVRDAGEALAGPWAERFQPGFDTCAGLGGIALGLRPGTAAGPEAGLAPRA